VTLTWRRRCHAVNKEAVVNPAEDTERIRVELVRTGGFGGMELHSTLDTARLPDAEADELAALVERAGLDPLGSAGADETTAAHGEERGQAMPDAFQYRLSVQRGGRRWHGVLDERQVPPELRPLLTKLVAHARSGRAGGASGPP